MEIKIITKGINSNSNKTLKHNNNNNKPKFPNKISSSKEIDKLIHLV